MLDFKGKLIVFSAPSGSGKTTIVRHLLHQEKFGLEFSISATSREARGKEIHGEDYYFISAEEFKQKIKADEFLECPWLLMHYTLEASYRTSSKPKSADIHDC